MTAMLPPITGYLDRLSRRPGERITAHVSLREPGPCRARLVRVVSADPNPAGPGLDLQPVPFDHAFEGEHQPVRLGSWGLVQGDPGLEPHEPRCWAVLVQLLADLPAATVLATEGGDGVVIRAAADGAEAEIAIAGVTTRLRTAVPMRAAIWYRVWLSHDPVTGRVVLGQAPFGAAGGAAVSASVPAADMARCSAMTFAARDAAAPRDHFTGKLEDPLVAAAFIESWPEPQHLPASAGSLRARWNFSVGIASDAFSDTGAAGLHGTLFNMPVRGAVGAAWTGRETCWRHAPDEYAAIHFHADDLEDCGWKPSFTFDVPRDMRSGAYAFHLTCDGGEDWLPFYVLPRRGEAQAPVAFLASTFTYQAYANHARGNADAAYKARAVAWGAYPHNPDDVHAFGHSTYNRHPDGSGISLSSRLRPILTMRPGFLTFNDPKGSGLRHYPADSHLLAWLEARGIDFDVITDEDLDDEGTSLLSPYSVVLTGSHPEYHTERMLDALTAYRDRGGRLCYLGGNGFYWRIARDPARPHIIEIRRAEGGIRAWAAEAGEYYHQIDGALGGLWRRNRRPPQALVGVGFSAQGLFEGTFYRRLPASEDPRHAWIFEGVPEVIGDYGLSGGGAAGFELDRADPRLGTPPDTVILARSEQPPASFVTVPEELLSHIATVTGESPEALKRAEIVFFEVPGGGAVFAVGSITFCGSLWNGTAFDGPVSRMLENVVRRFAGL
ncbi:N,N-dimethylformamidase beta subunit family domain-containing protein [Teichococcus vastitatis]|uniref:N,N-dimethylformamidase large subunit n=2 Tax=Teichococcus vastitatis TaxID=2307076 RepID=A0ABS9W6H8_9PROT|nr:N,N-dimethylformamidase beta subunit family domain-containing protein [Pseudoroseomonas vastitatis]MCI0754897.1 N,N-dimethylformamidase large subunit [Pseudoroseomonas vastitatis]